MICCQHLFNYIIIVIFSLPFYSSFCIVPLGDTSMSRRFFDALSFGCIPIVFGHISHFQTSLPFPSIIDWTRVGFYRDIHCVLADLKHTARWLAQLVGHYDARHPDIVAMISYGSQVYEQYLKVAVQPWPFSEKATNPNVITSLLRQMKIEER
eukprot:m.81038 g.81038  ORF g.81038 m.81038 type:complete len:153 (+) comp20958_c0_seq1:47-505(+)